MAGHTPELCGATTLAVMALGGVLALAQTATSIAPLRTAPVEKFTVNPGHRDWARTVLAGTTIIGGNSSNRGGLFAVDTTTGKLKWAFRPTGTASGNPFVATAPAVSDGLAIVPMGNTLVAATIATGREAWRGPATAQSAAVATDSSMAFMLGEDAGFHALDAATGREKWALPFSGVTLYAINLATGRDLWPPVEVRAPIDGRERAFPLRGLVDAGMCWSA